MYGAWLIGPENRGLDNVRNEKFTGQGATRGHDLAVCDGGKDDDQGREGVNAVRETLATVAMLRTFHNYRLLCRQDAHGVVSPVGPWDSDPVHGQ
jgi:hypothetical protein